MRTFVLDFPSSSFSDRRLAGLLGDQLGRIYSPTNKTTLRRKLLLTLYIIFNTISVFNKTWRFELTAMKFGVDFVQRGGSATSASDDEGDRGKYHLVEFDDLPTYMKHNEFILGHYRSEWPWKQTFLSIFSIHNETVNIWTYVRT